MLQNLFSCPICLPILSLGDTTAFDHGIPPNPSSSFSRVREDLVASAPLQVISEITPLAAWRPGQDLGTLLLEGWAYVGDVLSFYAHLIKTESYLPSAQERTSQRKLVSLLGYHPQPAVASQTEVGAIVGAQQMTSALLLRASLPDGSNQTLEGTLSGSHSQRFNEFLLSPLRTNQAAEGKNNTYFLDTSTAAPVRGRPVVFVWFDKAIIHHKATEITATNAITRA